MRVNTSLLKVNLRVLDHIFDDPVIDGALSREFDQRMLFYHQRVLSSVFSMTED